MATYTVPGDAVYANEDTGARYRFFAGDVIALETAVALGMPDARLSADPNRTMPIIHNYFPDGDFASAALIDVANDFDYDEHPVVGYTNDETLAWVTGYQGGNALKVTIADWGEGVSLLDWSNRYGWGNVPSGHYRIGFDLSLDFTLVGTNLRVEAAGAVTPDPYYAADFAITYASSNYRRIVGDIYTSVTGRIGFHVYATEADNPTAESAPSGSFFIRRVMISEGEVYRYMDGDATGWDWTGAANASPSYGPQP